MQNQELITCFSCGARVPKIDGPIHPYMLSAPGCWLLYGEILAKEYNQENYDPDTHRITVDTYAVTHPGTKEDRRAIQSVNIHLIRMYFQFEKQIKGKALLQIIKAAAENVELHNSFTYLKPPSFVIAPNINNVLRAQNVIEHRETVNYWGLSVWNLWKNQHGRKIELLASKINI